MTQPQDGLVQPQVTPLSWQMGTAPLPNGQKVVVLIFHTVLGQQHYFLSPDDTDRLIAMLAETSRSAREPTILQPVRHLTGPDGRPIFFDHPVPPPPAPGEPVGPPQEQITDPSEEPNHKGNLD